MLHVSLAFGCALALLCPVALSRQDASLNKTDQIVSQIYLAEKNDTKVLNTRSRVRTPEPPIVAAVVQQHPAKPLSNSTVSSRIELQNRDPSAAVSTSYRTSHRRVGKHVITPNKTISTDELTSNPQRSAVTKQQEYPKNTSSTEDFRLGGNESTNLSSADLSTSLLKLSLEDEPPIIRHMKEYAKSFMIIPKREEDEAATRKLKRDSPPVMKRETEMFVAVVGHLFVQQVPEETFFDEEEGGTRNLTLTLRMPDGSLLLPEHWLQFNEKNQELYGLPDLRYLGIEEYLLIAMDKSKGKARNIVKVKVVKGPILNPHIEFFLVLENSFMDIAYNARNKRSLIENIADVFGHKNDTSIIRISNIRENPTTIKWYNTSLPSDRCPLKEINEIIDKIKAENDENLKESVEDVFHDKFKITSLKIFPLGKCGLNVDLPREFLSMYTPKSVASRDAGDINNEVLEKKLVSFVIPTVVISVIVFTALFSMYMFYREARTDREYLPVFKIF